MNTGKPNTAVPKIRFEKSSYFFMGLFVLVFLGFWKSYFSKFFEGSDSFSTYLHLHAVLMLIWVAMLVVQPMLIRKKKMQLHRTIGKVSYVLMPLLLFTVLMIMNNALKVLPEEKQQFILIIFPFRDFFLLAIAFSLAIIYRRKIQIHARAMIITGIIFVEPALFRFLFRLAFKGNEVLALVIGITVMLGILTTLIILERKQKTARWLFPAFLIIDIFVYTIFVTETDLSALDPIARWIASLPLT